MMTENHTTTAAAAKPPRTRQAKAPTAAPDPVPAPASKPTSKPDTVIKLLLRAKGATPIELMAATDWQPHSLRAFLSGLRKKGRVIAREERKGGGFAYRIVTERAATLVSAEASTTAAAAHASGTQPPSDAADGATGTAMEA